MTYRELEMPCPECGTPLTQYDGREKWRCADCGGLLVGTEEVDLVMSTPKTSHDRKRPCPRCRRDMFAFELGPLTLDRCENDRVMWLDLGELGRLRTLCADPAEGWAEKWAALVRFGL